MTKRRTRLVIAIGILGGLEALIRVVFYYEAVYGGVSLLQPMPPASTMNIVNPIELALGIAGLVAVSGLLLMTGWGYWGTIVVSILTIVFDGVSSVAISYTALAGLVLPIIFLVALLRRRAEYFGGKQSA